jgi:hypothetical protein
VAGRIARAGRGQRHDDEEPEQREPRYHHSRDPEATEGPSYGRREEEHYHAAEGSGEGPYHSPYSGESHGESHYPGSHGHYPPIVPLYPQIIVNADVAVYSKEGQETITGELTGANFSDWSE